MARYKDVDGYRKLFDEEYKKTRKLISEGETHLDNLAEGFSEASRVIDRMPTADVVKVVRCKDCRHGSKCTDGYYTCRVDHRLAHDEDDFCSYGEKKTEGGGADNE